MPEDRQPIDTNEPLDSMFSQGDGGVGDGGPDTNVEDPILQDIDKLFGDSNTDSNSSQGGKQKSQGSPSFQGGDPFQRKPGDTTPNNPEELLKRLQSERDSARASVSKYEAELKQYRPIAEFINSLPDDEAARKAFIAELEPDLVKPKDALTFVKEGLKKEFGEEFTPNIEESGVFGSPTWLYNERARDLLSEWKNQKTQVPTSLKELRETRKRKREEETQAAMLEKQEIMTKRKWDDNRWDSFAKWVGSVKGIHMAAFFDYIENRRESNKSPFSLAGMPGGSPLKGSKMMENLDKFFGQ